MDRQIVGKSPGRLFPLPAFIAIVILMVALMPEADAGRRPDLDWSLTFNPGVSSEDLGATLYSRTDRNIVYFAGNGTAHANFTPPPEGVPRYPYSKLLPEGAQFDFHFQSRGVYVGRIDTTTNSLEFFSFVLFGPGTSSTLRVTDMAIDSNGDIYVVGSVSHFIESQDEFPVTNRFAGCRNPGASGLSRDGFVVKISADGEQLLLACYYGGSGDDDITGIEMLSQDRFVLSGFTTSPDLVISAPVATNLNGPQDGYVAVHLPNGALYRSAYFGGSGSDALLDVAVASSDRIIAAGLTDSTDVPTSADAYQPMHNGQLDALIAEFDIDLGVNYASYVGGSANESFQKLESTLNGTTYLVGTSNSIDYPTVGRNANSPLGSVGAIISKFSSDLRQLEFSTFHGQTNVDFWAGESIGISSSGDIAVGGQMSDPLLFPPVNSLTALDNPAYQPGFGDDGFVVKWLNVSGEYELDYQTLIGSRGRVLDVEFNGRGEVLISGDVFDNRYLDTSYHFQQISLPEASFGPFVAILTNDVPTPSTPPPSGGGGGGGGGGPLSMLILAFLLGASIRQWSRVRPVGP